MNRIFLTHILPEQLIRKFGLSFAAYNFSVNLMSGGGFDNVYSTMGTHVGGTMDVDAYQDERYELIYCQSLRDKGRIGRLCATIVEQWQVYRKVERNSSVWFYNVTTLNAFLYLLLRILKPSVQVNVIVLDFTPVEKGMGLNQWFLKIINNCHGNIRLAESSLFTNKNFVTLPGVVPSITGKEPIVEKPNNKFLLSGVLNDVIAQVPMVLDTFASSPQCELHITGLIDDETKILEYADKYPNIIWHGHVAFSEFMSIMHSCTFQLNTRDAAYPENQCNFPSKIIEALLHNRIIVSTIKYKQLEGIDYLYVDSDLASCIESISKMPESQLMRYANQGKKTAEMFSTSVWNEAMKKIESR